MLQLGLARLGSAVTHPCQTKTRLVFPCTPTVASRLAGWLAGRPASSQFSQFETMPATAWHTLWQVLLPKKCNEPKNQLFTWTAKLCVMFQGRDSQTEPLRPSSRPRAARNGSEAPRWAAGKRRLHPPGDVRTNDEDVCIRRVSAHSAMTTCPSWQRRPALSCAV